MSRLVKSVVLVGMFALASNVWAAPASKPTPVPVDIKIKTSRVVPIDDAVRMIDMARASGESWARDPVTIALRVSTMWPDTSGERSQLRLAVDEFGESFPRTISITLTISGLNDDSVGAEWHQVRLDRTGNDWKLVEHRTANLCLRGADAGKFIAGPCP